MDYDELLLDLKKRFKTIEENHPNEDRYKTSNMLMCGFALFALKDSSLLKFVKELKDRASNLKSIFHITQAPSDTTMRKILDKVPTQELKELFTPYIEILDNEGVLDDYKYLDRLLIPLDGTQYFVSKTLHCECCLTKHHRNGTITYLPS